RRHTRFSRDWSSDVCSSDLVRVPCQNPSSAFFSCLSRPIRGKPREWARVMVFSVEKVGEHCAQGSMVKQTHSVCVRLKKNSSSGCAGRSSGTFPRTIREVALPWLAHRLRCQQLQ